MSSGYPTAPSAPPAPPAWEQSGGYSSTNNPPPAYGRTSSSYGHPQPHSAASQHPPAKQYSQSYHSPGPQWGQQNPSSFPQPSASYPGGSYPPPYPYPQQSYGASSYFPPGTDPEIIRAFQAADRDGSGIIDAPELQKVLSTSHPFSMRTVRLLIHQFSAKGSDRIGSTDFVGLWKSLKEWRGIFERFDRDRSGSIDIREMREALLSLGYAISPPILQCLLQKYDRTGQARAMDYDSFIECGLIVKGLTEKFKAKDTRLTGSATLSYEDFMLIALPFIVA